MRIVGVTGGIGSGKTTVTDMLAEHGIDVIDADVLARDAVKAGSECLAKISTYFGQSILLENGELDRKKLRQRVFNQADDRLWLESLIHPEVRRITIAQLALPSENYKILASPLLLETEQKTLVDRICVVDLPLAEQVARACQRDKSKQAEIEAIIKTQMTREQRLACADDIIDNSGSLEQTRSSVNALHTYYTELHRS